MSVTSYPQTPLFSQLPTTSPLGPEWAVALREAVNAIKDRELFELSAEERVIVGRWHAYRFANCRRNLKINVSKGSHVASALASMAASREFQDFTVDEYLGAACAFYELRGKIPWFQPWDIRAVVPARELKPRWQR